MSNINFLKKCIQYEELNVDKYLNDLKIIGSLSRLFSENDIPLLHYRVVENLYCSNFNAKNLSRSDISTDAKLGSYGIGIKTFIEGNKSQTFQKIAEFNKQLPLYNNLDAINKIKKISELRNKRLEFAINLYEFKKLIYHCVVRKKQSLFLFEEKMNFINIDNIKLISESNHSYFFKDGKEIYKFDASKSTLYKKFLTKTYFACTKVEILKNPIEILRKISFLNENDYTNIDPSKIIIVPLYSLKNGEKYIYKRSGLNQWNARGRERDPDEVYIPFNSVLRDLYDNFFPSRNTSFDVFLPNGKKMSMKLCQENCKAIMSNPNKELGKWLLRDILKIPYGKIIEYKDLLEIGIDSVSFKKVKKGEYLLNFEKIGQFDKYLRKYHITDY